MKNRYRFRSRISEKKFREILKLFALDLEAAKIAKLTGLNRKTINRYLKLIRDPHLKRDQGADVAKHRLARLSSARTTCPAWVERLFLPAREPTLFG